MNDNDYMQYALELAQQAAKADEVPVGAVCVYQNKIIAAERNRPIGSSNPVAHAEVLALQKAAKVLQNYRLPGVTLYVTLEPCMMCAGAMVHARIDRLVFGAYDEKTGVCGSRQNLLQKGLHNHTIEITGGVLQKECGELLSAFFRQKRLQKKAQKQANKQTD